MIGEYFWETLYESVTGRKLPEPEQAGQSMQRAEPPCCDSGIAYVLVQGIIDGVDYIRKLVEKPRDPLSGGQIMLFCTLEGILLNFSIEPDRRSRRTGENPKVMYLSYKGEEFATAYGRGLDIRDESIIDRHPEAEKLIETINHCIYHKEDDIEVLRDDKEMHDPGAAGDT
jgi:hypothetical protein